jgi:ferric-dicitrate binding protein FerR (iron transport regulator)
VADFVSYEIHTYRNGQWKIDSVYDDREIALYEAQRLQGLGRAAGIRVVEERFNSDSGKINNRTIFRAAKADEANNEALERQKAARNEVQAKQASKAARGELKPSEPPAERPRPSPIALTLTLGAIVLAGIGVIVALRYLAGAT